ncbi:bifunctional metallophosphatase/5'-nucleotidase [Alkalihalobacillus sp. LMS6]|uniref:bifunctional metallophosphatase/5'-nucleotidase n=1 Tax=Alkalihalobacillus sp. LMS6 TaxID=2924034 RepID=UPI0020D1813B|nr:bifunctional UDP-sugar hydrolase/5'-nucleotidase [Alkalihalobacillus sp. LMS6]UTR05523.1 bifunctional metallophosphatase/5'-nucleotidase [Alkalihalobacillus sp. LMS6]
MAQSTPAIEYAFNRYESRFYCASYPAHRPRVYVRVVDQGGIVIKTTVTIFHTNDIHSGFQNWSNIVGYIKQHRSQHTRYVDLGDHADRANPMTEATAGVGNIQLLNEANVDFATIGNNEGVTFSQEMLDDMYSEAQFQIILANLRDRKTGQRPHWAVPSLIDEMDGIRIGYIGYTSAMTHFYEQLGWDVSYTIDDIQADVNRLKPDVDAVILLSHLGLPKDEMIAKNVQGIAAIIGAHTHHSLHGGLKINETWITQAGKHGNYFGELTLTFEQNQLIHTEPKLIDPTQCQEDESSKQLLETLNQQATTALSEPIIALTKPFDVKWFEPTHATQGLCDALTEWCGEEIGMLNAGVLMESLPKGNVTYGDIHRICPHPINPCIVELTGKQLIDTIRRAQTDDIVKLELKGFGFRGKVLGLMLFTGIDITSEGIFVKGEHVVEDAMYRLATLDMYTFGFLFPHIANAAYKQYLLPEFLRDIVAKLLQTGTNTFSFS